jgi:hypothetical protein
MKRQRPVFLAKQRLDSLAGATTVRYAFFCSVPLSVIPGLNVACLFAVSFLLAGRACGLVFCWKCSQDEYELQPGQGKQRVCVSCLIKLVERGILPTLLFLSFLVSRFTFYADSRDNPC